MPFGPTFEDAEESNALPTGEYVVTIKNCEAAVTKDGKYLNGATYHYLKIGAQIDEGDHTGRFLNLWAPLTGKFSFIIQQLATQAGLTGISKYFDVKHPDYVGNIEPLISADEIVSDEEGEAAWTAIAEFYVAGRFVFNGREVVCDEGGLMDKTIRVTVGKPGKNDKTGEEQTGFVKPLKA